MRQKPGPPNGPSPTHMRQPPQRPSVHQPPQLPASSAKGPQVIAGTTTRAGQGLTTFLVHAAWELAEKSQVLLVDLDEAGGTIAESLRIPRAVVEAQSVENFYTGDAVSTERILANAVTIKDRSRLRVIPGRSASSFGRGLDLILPQLKEGLRGTGVDYVILDLGACLAYPAMLRPDDIVAAIRDVSSRVWTVLGSDPLTGQHAIQVLNRVGRRLLPDVVMWEYRKGWGKAVSQTFRDEVADIPVRSIMDWNESAYDAWLTSGRPTLDVEHAIRDLKLI